MYDPRMDIPRPADPVAQVDWYLDRMRTNLNRDMRAVYVWDFTLRTRDVDSMHALAKALRKARYVTSTQEMVLEISTAPADFSASGRGNVKGNVKGKVKGKGKQRRIEVEGPPMVDAFYRGKPSAAVLKRRVRAILAIAAKHRATYSDMTSMDLEDFEMFYGPPKAMPLDDACWRLRGHSDLGLKKGAKIEYTFCLVARDVQACTAALKKAGFAKVQLAPKDANWAISVSVPGVNDEKRLKAEFAAMKKAAKTAGASLKGLEM